MSFQFEPLTLTREAVRATFRHIGEGYGGEYDPTDPSDEPLLRFDIDVLRQGGWEPVDNASYCTRLSALAAPALQRHALYLILNKVHDEYDKGNDLAPICRELSWIDDQCFGTAHPQHHAAPARSPSPGL